MSNITGFTSSKGGSATGGAVGGGDPCRDYHQRALFRARRVYPHRAGDPAELRARTHSADATRLAYPARIFDHYRRSSRFSGDVRSWRH
jgi:hypothetical protein